MDAPWGVCAVERQYRDRQTSLASPVDSADREVRLKLAWFAGVDWGSQTHQVCVLDSAGKVRGERAFEHGGAGLSEMADWLLAFAAAEEAGEIGVAVETPRGPVVESLMERGFVLHSINPKQLDRFRDRFSPAGAKDDRRDARVLASALRTDPHCLRRLEPTDPAVIELREWSRISEDLTRERTRLANRMREQLWRYYPQFLAAIGDDIAAPWTLALWRSLPTPAAAQRVRETTLAKLLKQHRIPRIDAATLRGRLRVPAVQVAPGAAEAAAAHVRLVAERLVLVNRQRVHARGQLDRLVRQFAEAAPVDAPKASAEAEPGLPEEPPDAAILMSLPGIGTVVLATLLAEASDALRRRDYHALRCLCGVAPVTRRSGKSLIVVRRLAAHDRLRDAAYHWARVAAQRDPASRAKYQVLRAAATATPEPCARWPTACSTSPAPCSATAPASTRTVPRPPPRERREPTISKVTPVPNLPPIERLPLILVSPMTEPPVGAVGTPSTACPSRGGRVCASTATSASTGHPVTSRSRLNMVEEHTDNGACKTVGSPPPGGWRAPSGASSVDNDPPTTTPR